MSEVKRYIIGRNGLPELHDSGEYVATSDYDALAAEAQALREEVAEYEALCNRQAELLSQSIVAIRGPEPELTRWGYADLPLRVKTIVEEVAALRARVAVVPDASTVYAALDARERLFTSPENIQVALEAQSRINGKTVSEGLLRKWLELMEHGDYREGHCMCGSPVDSHGIGDGHTPIDAGEYYAGQVMEELRDLLSEQA
ncbi:TPA: hypothetical protein ACKR0C_005081 [Pseudomonas aeruginosa]|uniref:hypothetical protein n=1 Tax=Pseudomonas aeruginosa TaxID=287 RepID=UPI001A344C78|nr:hypothetical protein [Pseudomonas aeruginosa]ELL2372474.1 hypothetical protein [Pseudomonas aeruginosa]MBI7749239.1 hypothetical protein [Pseudomonas aeruginosa]MBI8731139.1 hypothetical protein [Pseudomonas aeruginosa]MBV5487079.1 hypothetical protein [Pseudomonas aeruginosa]MCR3768232.1 hypothetical protein [Pseudomonas aeruginosa]